MRPGLVSRLICPTDHTSLFLDDFVTTDGIIDTGTLHCPNCSRSFCIKHGIAQFLPAALDEYRTAEIAARIPEYIPLCKDIFDDRFIERDTYKWALGSLTGKSVLDAGCGNGAITELFPQASIVAMDISFQGLKVFPKLPSVDRFHADVCAMPYADGIFDACISSQVLEHVPTPEERRQFIGEIARCLKPGGTLALSVYNWSANRRGTGARKEGRHPNGVFFHCYSQEELRAELSAFDIDLFGVEIIPPMMHRVLKGIGKARLPFERVFRVLPFMRDYGNLLLAIGTKR